MTFPAVLSTNTSVTVDNTTHTVSLPATIAAGNFIVIDAAINGTPTVTPPTDFTMIKSLPNSTATLAVFVKVAAGTEGGTTVTFTTSVLETSGHTSYAGGSWDGTLAGIEVSTGATGTSVNPLSDAITASWGAADNLFISALAIQRTPSLTSYPTSHPDNRIEAANGGGGSDALSAMASVESALATNTPTAYTAPISRPWAAATIAIKPAIVATLSLTAPDTVTHGTATTATGVALNTVTTMNIKLDDDSVTLAQSPTLGGATLPFTPDIGQPTVAGGATAVSALPETGTGVTLSSGTTAYQNVLEVSDV